MVTPYLNEDAQARHQAYLQAATPFLGDGEGCTLPQRSAS